MHRPQTSQRGRSFPMRCEYSFHSGGGAAATVLTAIRTSRRVARSSVISTGVVDPETVAITNSRSKEAFDRPCDETRSRIRALWQGANRMAIGNHALHPVLSFRAEARRPRRL